MAARNPNPPADRDDPQVQIRIPQELLDRLNYQSEKLVIGRNVIMVKGIENIVRFLEARPDPFADYLPEPDAGPMPAEAIGPDPSSVVGDLP